MSSERLKDTFDQHVVCGTCTEKFHRECQVRFHRVCDAYLKEQHNTVIQQTKTPDKNLVALHDIISLKTRMLWIKFTKIDQEYVHNREGKCEPQIKRRGLARNLEERYTYRSQHYDGHSWSVHPLLI